MYKEAMRVLIPLILLLSSAVSNSAGIQEGTDPITKEKFKLEKEQVGSWDIYTFPQNNESFIMVGKKGKPVLTNHVSNNSNTVSVHEPNNPSVTAVDIYDTDRDGVYDRILYYQQDGSNGVVEAKLIQGRWVTKQFGAK
ncbi:hypothetical protein [Neptuniibacter sp. QD57_21]|uniref:hypothetical protein n=1 Tax=Neptuniibacter sp. QD57_21 TaxID=3398213 RepID=UPI0039F4F96F